MKPSEALTEVKNDLTTSFGDGLTARIIFNARDITKASIFGLDKNKYIELIKTIASDDRVKGMWGDFGAKEKYSKWEKLVL